MILKEEVRKTTVYCNPQTNKVVWNAMFTFY